jgi:hypothetical protein
MVLQGRKQNPTVLATPPCRQSYVELGAAFWRRLPKIEDGK